MGNNINISELVGNTVTYVHGLEYESETVVIGVEGGFGFEFYHEQDCCEDVRLIDNEYDDMVGGVILSAEEVNSKAEDVSDCGTYTFYKIETTKGSLWMRWLGESNGYYSEAVSICIC